MEKSIYFGPETKRAIKNFPISGQKPDPTFVKSIVLIKKAAASVNSQLGLLNKKRAQKIIAACDQILSGMYIDQFVVDVFHSGAGTSLHMNVNEVIANLSDTHVYDDVNFSQSTNDVMPTALRITILHLMPDFLKSLAGVIKTFNKKGQDFQTIIKPGRTHLRDALPVSMGKEFKAYGDALVKDIERIKRETASLNQLGIGGTAVGTGINSHPNYSNLIIQKLNEYTGIRLKKVKNLQESMQNTADFLALSSSLRILSQNFIRIGNDLRLMSSGPGTGMNEINLPEVQNGSSIMPGKVNPSILEMLTMVCFQVIGFDQAILLASMSGQLELNVFLPLIAHNLISQIKILTNSLNVFDEKCLKGINVNNEMTEFWLYRSTGSAAILNTHLGYEKGAKLMKEAIEKRMNIADFAVKKGFLSKRVAKKIFNLRKMIKPNL